MKDLGSMNGWRGNTSYPNGWDGPAVPGVDNTPQEYTLCQGTLDHPLVAVNKGRCWTQFTCPICGITWDCDSSD